MTCKFCGNVIEDNSDICFICGQKVEPVAAPAEAVDAFAPVAPAAPVAPVAPAAPVATAAPVYAAAPAAPVYAAAPAVPAAADIKAQKKALKAAKKAAKKEGKGNGGKLNFLIPALLIALTFALKDLCYIFVGVLLAYTYIVYRSYNKALAAGNTDKANGIVNKTMSGAILGMAIACVLLIKTAFIG